MSGLFAGTPWERPVTCEHCEQPLGACTCPRNADGEVTLPGDQPTRVRREKRSHGKVATIITGLDPTATDLLALLKELKSAIATGGTVRDDTIELQGDHCDRVVALLHEKGYPAKPAAG